MWTESETENVLFNMHRGFFIKIQLEIFVSRIHIVCESDHKQLKTKKKKSSRIPKLSNSEILVSANKLSLTRHQCQNSGLQTPPYQEQL